MGERKGQTFYYPPDFDYKKHKSLNSYHGTHALRERAAKIKQGILIIRFEMPFNIWCLGCNNHIGMGVRYNAEKKKIGMYYTTPLYEFRMKCHLCDNYFTIRTDPEHFDYELVEGCRRQEKRYDPSTIAQLGAVDRTFNRKLEGDKMFKVEHIEKDKEKKAETTDGTEKLEWIQERMRDDFAANQALRRSFRRDKTELREQRAIDDDLLQRSSLNLPLLPESMEDKKQASLLLRYERIRKAKRDDARPSTSSLRNLLNPSKKAKPSSSGVQKLASSLSRRSNPFEKPTSSKPTLTPDIGVVVKKLSSAWSSEMASPASGYETLEATTEKCKESRKECSSSNPDDSEAASVCPGQVGAVPTLCGRGKGGAALPSLVADYGESSSSGIDE